MTTSPLDAEILIRRAYPDDDAGLLRLAALDSARPPKGRLLVAELDGELSAALSLDDGTAIADPFKRTAEVLALLRLYAAASSAAGADRPNAPRPERLRTPVRWPALGSQ